MRVVPAEVTRVGWLHFDDLYLDDSCLERVSGLSRSRSDGVSSVVTDVGS